MRCGISGQDVYRYDWTVRLDPTYLAFAQYINGELSIREIAQRIAQSGLLAADQSELELIALELFEACGGWTSSPET